MKKVIGIALITLGMTSCGGNKYLPCPAYGNSWTNTPNGYHETEGQDENKGYLTLKDFEVKEL
tara:strand:- start:181 stop:369 length:189 start_codon:yes stop_codon:yes gene_type:complete